MASSQHETILHYHEATKHRFHRYAHSAGYMDWENQPGAFRIYEGAPSVRLPLIERDPVLSYADLYEPVKGPGRPLSAVTVGAFLELSMGLSAWKVAGQSRWALRINPSSGNLHPTETYLVIPDLPGLVGGVMHYNPLEHALARRIVLPADTWPEVEAHFNGRGFFVALSSISWRESWKYGERASRYCNLDAGHALAALAFSARLQGWALTSLTGAGDDQIGILLGFDRTVWGSLETEVPDLLCWVSLDGTQDLPSGSLPEDFLQHLAARPVEGRPNRLSQKAVDWAIIAQAEAATSKPVTAPRSWDPDQTPWRYGPPQSPVAAAILRQRRSAVSYDPHKSISAGTLFSILDRTLTRSGVPPFDVRLMPPAVQLLVFVHRVEGVSPGIYLLARSPDRFDDLRSVFKADFDWQPVKPGFPFWLLRPGDVSMDAMELSCHQEIAGYGAFALAMLAPFDVIAPGHAYRYRHLHWECGMIGQVLYLEAEAHGIRGTGIGCFFDDGVHQLLGIQEKAYQSLYHFTVGHPIEDDRLTTLPPYHHLNIPSYK